MKVKLLLVAIAAVLFISSCGTANQVSDATGEAAADSIKVQTDPLIITLNFFEGRAFSGKRSFIAIYNNHLTARIPTVTGMVRTGVATSEYALEFKNVEARLSEARVDKNGTKYTFNVSADGAQLFGKWVNAYWRMTISVRKSGHATVTIESDSIGRIANSRSWIFDGEVDKDRTEAAILVKSTSPTIEFD